MVGNIWNYYNAGGISICITTNGVVNQFHKNIMGAGIALEAKRNLPGFDRKLGELILNGGNQVYEVFPNVFSFPTKYKWWDKSDLNLIIQSCKQLMKLCNTSDILLPRPGCNNGGLDWNIVKLAIEPYLDDRVVIITKE